MKLSRSCLKQISCKLNKFELIWRNFFVISNSQIENCLESNCSPQSSSNGSKPGFLGKLPTLQSTQNAMASVEVMSVQLLVMIKKLIKDFIKIRESACLSRILIKSFISFWILTRKSSFSKVVDKWIWVLKGEDALDPFWVGSTLSDFLMPKYKSPEAYILKLESFNTYLSIPRVLSLNSVKKNPGADPAKY